MRHTLLDIIGASAALALLVSCKATPSGDPAPAVQSSAVQSSAVQSSAVQSSAVQSSAVRVTAPSARFIPYSPYAPGAWRRAPPQALDNVVLWPSHLLIRYAGVKVEDSVSFVMSDFHSVPPPATRTREQALALATELSGRARAHPERFTELVRQYSEDIVRRDRGGSLGGIPAAQLSPWPELLDALSQLRPGEVSLPVETWYGFHILLRRAPPEAHTVSGRRIVIGHAQAGFLRTLNGGVAPTRPRADALALADRVRAEAEAHPERFAELVQQYSELRDRVVGGDFGTWSNRELSPFPSEVEALDGLDIDEVSPPFDSLFGIQIVQRVPDRERLEYAIDGLRLPFAPGAAPDDERSQQRVLERARALNRQLLGTPDLLPELQSRDGAYFQQWIDGRGSPEVTRAVAAVQPGQLLPEPARGAMHFVIGRRVVPRQSALAAPSFELPGS